MMQLQKNMGLVAKIKERIWQTLCKSDKFSLYNYCCLHSKDSYVKRMLAGEYNNSDWLHLYSRGDEYSGQIIYHIEEYGGQVGFFCELIFTLLRLAFADERGLTPYVYWGKEHLYYETEGVEGEYNVFCYYFEPVSQVKNIERASFVVDSSDEQMHELQNRFDHHGYAFSEQYIKTLALMTKKYLRYNAKTKAFLENEFVSLIGNKKTLGVHFRGTDYRRQYNNHPIFVTLEQEIEKVRELMETGKYELIFLATDEQEAVNAFTREFGDQLKAYSETFRASEGNESVAYSHSDRKNHHYLLGLEAIRDQYTLSRCAGLVCGLSNLSITARIMHYAWYDQPYENMVLIDNGTCVNENAFCNAVH